MGKKDFATPARALSHNNTDCYFTSGPSRFLDAQLHKLHNEKCPVEHLTIDIYVISIILYRALCTCGLSAK